MAHQLFGTDGIRGRFGDEPITPLTMLKLGWAIGSLLKQRHGGGEVLIGKDTRVSGYLLESSLTSGLCSAGIGVRLMGPVPTPAVVHFCRSTDAIAGIAISASHNPYYDNGIKVFNDDGTKLDPESSALVEQYVDQKMQVTAAKNLGKARRFDESSDLYAEHCESLIAAELDGMLIALDCANGASYRIAPRVLEELGAVIRLMGAEPDGFNINRDCGSTNPQFIRELTRNSSADVGIALDGDGDRVVMVDERGELVNGDKILYVLALARKRDGRLDGGVVGTHLSNIELAKALQRHSIPFERVDVGDRFVSARLVENGWNLGGEECGHILTDGSGIAGDGLVAALEVLEEMVKTGSTLSELVGGLELAPQVTRNVMLAGRSTPLSEMRMDEWLNTSRAIDDARHALSDCGRVHLRASGTEPLIRILVEGEDENVIARIADELADVVGAELAAAGH